MDKISYCVTPIQLMRQKGGFISLLINRENTCFFAKFFFAELQKKKEILSKY